MAPKAEGPGLWWQFLEFMGMTWPGHKSAPPDPTRDAPRCSACHNPMTGSPGAWRCVHHPGAAPAE